MVVGGEDIDVPRRRWDVDVRIVEHVFYAGQMGVAHVGGDHLLIRMDGRWFSSARPQMVSGFRRNDEGVVGWGPAFAGETGMKRGVRAWGIFSVRDQGWLMGGNGLPRSGVGAR